MASDIEINGSLVLRKSEFVDASFIDEGIVINITNPDSSDYSFVTTGIINSAGHDALSVDKKIHRSGNTYNYESYPVKGNYFSYSGENPFNRLIYPIPEKLGLGIHSTTNVYGELKFGPDVDLESIDLNVNEAQKKKFLSSIETWFPEVNENKLTSGYVGLRPKIKKDNKVCTDFIVEKFKEKKSILISLFGIESPGITSSLALGEYVATLYEKNT